ESCVAAATGAPEAGPCERPRRGPRRRVLEGALHGGLLRPSAHALPPYRRRKWAQKRAQFPSQRAHSQISSRHRPKLGCVRKTGFHFATNREEEPHVWPLEA